MRTIGKIIEMVANGEKPDYDELRLTVQALQLQVTTLQRTITTYAPALVKEGQFISYKAFLKANPEDWLGDNWHPDREEYQKRRKTSLALLDKAVKKEVS